MKFKISVMLSRDNNLFVACFRKENQLIKDDNSHGTITLMASLLSNYYFVFIM